MTYRFTYGFLSDTADSSGIRPHQALLGTPSGFPLRPMGLVKAPKDHPCGDGRQRCLVPARHSHRNRAIGIGSTIAKITTITSQWNIENSPITTLPLASLRKSGSALRRWPSAGSFRTRHPKRLAMRHGLVSRLQLQPPPVGAKNEFGPAAIGASGNGACGISMCSHVSLRSRLIWSGARSEGNPSASRLLRLLPLDVLSQSHANHLGGLETGRPSDSFERLQDFGVEINVGAL
jgi:hypothetical protein